ncbi:MAG: ABC transporter permease [bacterium]|nr:ABC transporter permease [bacterium]
MMKGPKLASMAWRNLWRNKRRTVLTLVSIAFGGSLSVFFTAMQDRSFANFIDTAARLGGGHVSLQHPEYLDRPSLNRTVSESDRLREMALADPDVERAVARIRGQIMLSTARDNYGAFFIAYDPEIEDEDTLTFTEGLVAGELFATARDRGIILGKRLARNLSVELGDKVVYTLTGKGGEITAGMARLKGIIGTGAPSLDAGLCLLPLDTLRVVVGYAAGESTQVAVFLADSRRSAAVARRLGEALGPETAILTWEQTQAELAGFIAMKVGGARVMEVIIMILVAAGIFNTLFVSVMERLREFGIMVAIGFNPGQLFKVVMWESFWLGLVGLVAGALFTAWPYYYMSTTGFDTSSMIEGAEVAGVGFEPVLRVGIYPENLAIIAFAVVAATMLAGLYPAWRAGHVVPVETIKLV